MGTIDILVNHAANIKRIPMLEMSAVDFRKVVNVDLNAPLYHGQGGHPRHDRPGRRQDHQHLLRVRHVQNGIGSGCIAMPQIAPLRAGARRRTWRTRRCSWRPPASDFVNGVDTGFFPHTVSNIKPTSPGFTPRTAIDGVFENNAHLRWPCQAWSNDCITCAELTIDFVRSVVLDELRLTLRADFPHDSW